MGLRGIANVGNIIEADGEESEEEKREREARNAGSAFGIAIGVVVGGVIGLTQQNPTPAEDVDDGEDENQGFEITM